ncbi:MAG: gliding motility-associated C-terminal domain-containing protein [Saprospiraceae bacterium]|nr:gliding motility-associated C-terminal domain-containing protein [Saprospiraceae bacterium]
MLLIAYNDNNGAYTCIDTAVQFIDPEWITTFYAPNAMTPGYGEEGTRHFRPVGMGIKEYEIAIYSPWGQLVWGSTELVDNQPIGFWDGTYRGEDVPQGAYAWLARIKFVNGVSRVFKGTVTVLR